MTDDRVLRLAIPNKGRLNTPTVTLLRDAGLAFEQTERALSVRVNNADIDILFVRAPDVVEMVADGVADLGITGLDLVEEEQAAVDVALRLGYGACDLTLAAPSRSDFDKPEDFSGLRIATSHPNLTERFFSDRSIDVSVIKLHGSVEVAPKLGVADAVADLVSTGSTLLVNGLRPVMTITASEAALIASATASAERSTEIEHVVTALQSVVAGRSKRYLLLNAAKAILDDVVEIIPGLESPTVVPLAEEGMVAVHSVVATDDVWSVLPELKKAGATDILVLPVGQLVP